MSETRRKGPGQGVAGKGRGGRHPLPAPKALRYYDVKRHWSRRIAPHLGDRELNAILARDLNKYMLGRTGRPAPEGAVPADLDPFDWRGDRRGRRPHFWRYVMGGACHWLVNFNLRLAMLAEPGYPWRIRTSPKHSTVWDGDRTIFEMNGPAFGVSVQESFEMVRRGRDLKPGRYRQAGYPEHYSQTAR
jgi:hypothetical protein